jgi:hypothetical protein
MRLLRTLAFTLFIVPCALAAPQNSQVSSAAVLPSVTAYALDRAKVTLPKDFAVPLNLLILSFQRDQQSVVDGWLPQLTASSTPSVQPWLLLVSPPENGLYRWWLNASLRSSLPASQPRRYTVPLYVNKGRFLQSLQVSSEQEVVLLLTDKTGHVLWRAAGPVTDAKLAGLSSFLKSAPH